MRLMEDLIYQTTYNITQHIVSFHDIYCQLIPNIGFRKERPPSARTLTNVPPRNAQEMRRYIRGIMTHANASVETVPGE